MAIIFAFVLIPLLGLLALTVDVGYAYGQRRMAQNVADTGALAGAQVIGEKLLGAPRTDNDVLVAIRDAARNSTGGFFNSSPATDYFSAVYVGNTYDANGNGVPYDLSPSVQVGSASGGTIPTSASGVRLTPVKINSTFFASALGANSLTAKAKATALALDIVGFGEWAPYAIWGGEDAHRCYNSSSPYDPSTGLATANDSVAGQTDYVYGCIPFWGGTQNTPSGGPNGGTGPGGLNPNCWFPPGRQPDPSTLGCVRTRVIYYSSSYQNRNVHNGDQPDLPNPPYGVVRWNVNNNNFKGFFHTNNQYINVGDTRSYDTGGGYAQGPSDLANLANCRNQSDCLMVMPVVRYATGQGAVSITIAGFLPVKIVTDPYGNSNDLEAEITMAVLSGDRNVKTGPCPTNGIPCLKVTRLVQ